jgi:predicted N-acetyltransferase YhbS
LAKVVVELLDRRYDRKAFDCGRAEETDFLRQRARKHSELGYSQTWVAVEEGSTKILGYISISMGSVSFEAIGAEERSRLPRYPMPVLHIGRLATDLESQGRGVAKLLLRFVLLKAREVSVSLGCYAVEIVARDEVVRDYYLRFGFAPLSEESLNLYLPISAIDAAL